MAVNIAELNEAQAIFLHTMMSSLQPRAGQSHIRFCQIGANVGVSSGDPLHKFIQQGHWKGLLIEPLPHIFDQLKANYAAIDGLEYLNAAIAEKDQEAQSLYYIPERPELSSLDKEVLLASLGGPKEDVLASVDVPCRVFNDIIDEYNLQDIDFLVIDTEGYDGRIIQSIDLAKLPTATILFEIKHLTEGQMRETNRYLESFGYAVVMMGSDALALREHGNPDPFFQLMRAIFDRFRSMERRYMSQLAEINDVIAKITANTPRT